MEDYFARSPSDTFTKEETRNKGEIMRIVNVTQKRSAAAANPENNGLHFHKAKKTNFCC